MNVNNAQPASPQGVPPFRTPWRTVAVLSAGLSILAAVLALGFTWTAVNAEPKGIPIGIVATDQQYAAIEQELPVGVFALHRVDDTTDARAQVADRTDYGAVILTGNPELIVASAASNAVSDTLTELAPVLGQLTPGAQPITVTDIAPWSPTDPNGTGFALAGFPVVLTGFIGGVILSFIVHGRWRRLAASLAYSALVVGTVTFALQGVLGILHGNPWANALTIGLTAATGTMLITGLNSLLGRIGIPLGVFFLLLLANPLAGFTMPPEFYPNPWGDLGGWLAPGAAATLLRAHSYFPDQNVTHAWLILTAWTALGTAMILARPGIAIVRPNPRSGTPV